MPATSPCVPCCSTPQNTQVPGIEGDPGADGANGQSAFTTNTADFIVPSIGSDVVVSLVNSDWMAVGQKVVFDGPATFEVVDTPGSTSATLTFLGYNGDVSPGATIVSGSVVSPSGTQPSLETSTQYSSGTVYSLTATPQLLAFGTTTPAVVIPSPGTWLIMARVKYDYNAATFAAVRTVTTLLRRVNNTPTDLTNGAATWRTEIITTLTYTAMIHDFAPLVYTTANSNDEIQMWGSIDVVPSAGSIDAMEACIVATKLT